MSDGPKPAGRSGEAMLWLVVTCCCTVMLLLAADWVGLIR
jgi:hypothetical protein